MIARRVRIGLAVASVLVLVVTGVAWGLYRDITAGITTTDVIAGGSTTGAQNILLVGVDSRTDAQGNPLPQAVQDQLHSGPDTGVLNSDTIIVLHVPKGGGAAAAFSIPRDAYVDIPGYRTDKINAAYPAVKELTAEKLVANGITDRATVEAKAGQAGRAALIKAVEGVTGLTINHYAEINLLGFYNLTTAIGGVDVCLKAAVDDDLSGAKLPAGPQTISGADALAFVRQRHGLPDGDLSRIRRQQVFLAAVADKILHGGTLTDPAALKGLVDVAQKSLVIDSGWDILGFAQQASDIAGGNLEFLTIPTRGQETNSRGDVVLVDDSEVSDFIDKRIADQAAAAAQAAAKPVSKPAPAKLDVIPSRYVVDVRNGSARVGLAGDVATKMRALGFAYGTIDNTDATPTSVVRYTGSDGTAARAVADQLGGIATESSSDVPPGHLSVLVGADFDPAMAPPPAAPAADPAPTSAPPPPPDAPITAAGVPCID
ncbi:LCP family protein [Pseudonocardia sp. GCM10023141]|uniref:LCP family protein n=1 Tax=Pseudonocardia sp. GCM10023141 TaxID=3252653 RepID=UPI0036061B7C